MLILMLVGDNDDIGDFDWEVLGWGYVGIIMFLLFVGIYFMELSVGFVIFVYYGGYLIMVR